MVQYMSTKEEIQKIENLALRIWQKYTPFQLQELMLSLWDDISNQLGMTYGFKPLYPLEGEGDKIRVAILGSGGFSTGREELVKAKELKNNLGSSPVEYTAVISNRARSNAAAVASEFDLPVIVLDYTQWRKENEISGSTKLFGFAAGEEPARDVLEERIKIKKSFDAALHDCIIEEVGQIPKSISLRGYDFILTDQLFSKRTEVDNTHPATLIIREDNGEPAFAGWQEDAYNKMRDDGIDIFTTSLIRVGYIGTYDDLIEVDAGELLAISPGNPHEYDKREDHYLLTLKATGLLPYFWGISKKPEEIEYLTKDGNTINISQRSIIVGNKIMSGRSVFGQNDADLEVFSKCL
jgi:folate-dependent phosphoribosylglycinamide formyltransferase PurN